MEVSRIIKSKSLWVLVLTAVSQAAFGAEGDNIGDRAKNVTDAYAGITSLMVSTAYIAGIGFGIAAIFKFKQHKDNPTQVPVGTPFTLLAVSAALVFLPGIYKPLGNTIFGDDGKEAAGGNTGAGAASIPGFQSNTGGGK